MIQQSNICTDGSQCPQTPAGMVMRPAGAGLKKTVPLECAGEGEPSSLTAQVGRPLEGEPEAEASQG